MSPGTVALAGLGNLGIHATGAILGKMLHLFKHNSFFLIFKFEIAKEQWILIKALPDVLKDASIHRDLASQKTSRIQHKRHSYLNSQAYHSVFSTLSLPTLLAHKVECSD